MRSKSGKTSIRYLLLHHPSTYVHVAFFFLSPASGYQQQTPQFYLDLYIY